MPAFVVRGAMSAEISDQPASEASSQTGRIRSLIERGDFARALVEAEVQLAVSPYDRDILYMAAVSLRHLNRVPEALSTLERLERSHPRFARLFQERGHCYVALRSANKAIDAFEGAVHLSAALPASWKALQHLYAMTGRGADADTAAAHVAKLASLPPSIVTASGMFADGDLHDAERIVRQFLLTHGDHIEGMRLLARIGMELDILDDAELLLANVLAIAPDYHAARYEYAVVLLRRHRPIRAREEIDKLLAIDPTSRVYRTTDAAVWMGFGDQERALGLYRRLSHEAPDDPDLHLSVAHAEKTLGNAREAIESYRTAAMVAPGYGEAYWGLANMKTYRFADAELERMRREEAAPSVKLADRYHLCFALGKALEDRREYAESFSFYDKGNELKRKECRYKPEIIETNTRLQRMVCTRGFFDTRREGGCDSRAPIFIVGLPRSGSTLLEQILASHSMVEGTMELAEIPRLVQDLQGGIHDDADPRYPGVLPALLPEDRQRFGQTYLADTRVYRPEGKPFFVDKNPNNFRHVGLIHLILPNAKIIDARRDAMACCFSNFKQLYAVGQQFTYSLEWIARYYRSYVELMQHWDDALPGKVLRIQHEDVVDDLEGNVRRILDFCGLDFEPACVQFYKTARSVNTASAEQVRQPIYREGLEQWRHFEPWLGPLRTALGPLAGS
jgi:tetratricopeptide (TPR) repeat protein